MRTTITFSFIVLLALRISAQESAPQFQFDNMLWFGYYNSLVINKKWSVNSDVQFRTTNWAKHPSQLLGRTGLAYKISDRVTAAAGLAHFRFYITDTRTRGEWRPWQELGLSDAVGKLKIYHRCRLEERFNQVVKNNVPIADYKFNFRVRYKLDLQYPLQKKEHPLLLIFGNELMVNAGRTIRSNYFDQNRTYIGLNIPIAKGSTLQFQLMKIVQLLSNSKTLDKITVLRFNYLHSINL